MASLIPIPKLQFIDNNGNPWTGVELHAFEARTSTRKDTWQDEAETILNDNPIIANARGEMVVFGKGSYKFVLVAPGGSLASPVWTVDDVTIYDLLDWSQLTASIADLNATDTSSLSKNTNYSIALSDRGKTILADSTSAKITISLLAAATAKNGYRITIKKVNISDSTKPVEIAGSGAETIDGVNTLNLYDINDYIEVLCDGSNWRIVSGQIRGALLPVSATDTITFDDHSRTYLADASSGGFTFNLLPSATVGDGFEISIKKTDSSSNVVTIDPNGTETIDGATTFALNTQHEAITLKNDGSNWQIISEYGAGGSRTNPLPRGYINGILISNSSGDLNHDIDFSAGEARSSDNTTNLTLASTLTKRIDANWVAGSGNGGFPSGLTLSADTWYHCFSIGKTDGTTDAGFDTSLTATNLLADATGYTKYRRVGAIRTDGSSNILQFKAYNEGSYRIVYLVDLVTNYSANPGTSAVSITLTTPPGLKIESILNTIVEITGDNLGDNFCLLSSLDTTDYVPSAARAQFCVRWDFNTEQPAGGQFRIVTNTSSQIRFRMSNSNGNPTARVVTVGWVESL